VCIELYQWLIELERTFILPLAPRWVRHSYLSKRLHTIPYTCGISICHIGHSVLHTPSSPLHLKNTLHVPSASKNLLFIHRLALDNHVFLEFHPFFFFGRTLFKGPCHGGLYQLVPFSIGSSKQVFSIIKLSSSTWHRRLGHPSSFVVQQIIRKNNLSHLP
jgi:hypothetical protein